MHKGAVEEEIAQNRKNWSYLLPLIAQSRGKFTANVCPKLIGQNLLNTFYGYRYANIMNTNYYNIAAEVYYDVGEGFKVEEVKKVAYKVTVFHKEKVEIKLRVPANTKYIRFDPCEGFMCVCSNIKCNVEGIKIHNTNGIRFGKEDLFLTKDPQYIFEGDFSNTRVLIITMENISIFWSENGLEKEMKDIFKEREELIGAVQHLLKYRKNLDDETKTANVTINELKEKNKQLENEISAIKATKSWRWTSWFRKGK